MVRLLTVYNLLTNRKQEMQIGAIISKEAAVTSSVLQGSVLWPTLFALYISDMLDLNLNSKIVSFADYTKIVGVPGV